MNDSTELKYDDGMLFNQFGTSDSTSPIPNKYYSLRSDAVKPNSLQKNTRDHFNSFQKQRDENNSFFVWEEAKSSGE